MKRIKFFHHVVTIITTVALVAGFSHLIPPEFKNVPKAQAAQITINDDLFTASFPSPSPRAVFTTDTVGYAFYVDTTNDAPCYKKTTDGGATWGGEVTLAPDQNWSSIAVWYDQWTPGDTTGTYIYMVAHETITSGVDDFYFKKLNTSDDTLTPTGTTWTKIADGTGDYTNSNSPVSITKSTEGNLFAVTGCIGAVDVYKSTNSGANWSTTTSGLDSQLDFNQVLPISLSGGGVILINQDVSGNDLRTNVYDEDTDSWSGFTIQITDTMVENTANQYEAAWGAAVNKLTGHVYFVGNDSPAAVAGDIVSAVATYNGSSLTWTNRTNVYSSIGTAGLHATVAIDQQNGDLYAFYLRGTPASAMSVYYKKSGNHGSTWSAESSAVSSATGNYQGIYANCASLYKIHVSWADLTNYDLIAVNYTDTSALDIVDARMMLFFDGASTPADWSNVSDTSYDILYQKFPRGNSTYSSGGADTHTHTATVSNVSGPDINFSSATTGIAFAESTHYHGFAAVTDAQSLMPSRRELQVMQYDAGIPSGASAIPDGAIAIFDTTSMPANWTRYSVQDNYFVRGGPDGEATGGGSIYQHLTTITQNASATWGIGNTGASPPAQALTEHEHTVGIQFTAGGDHTPVNIDIVLGKISGAGSIPGGMLAMFTAAPGGSWVSKSASSEDFYQKYFEAKSAYAASGGGAATHNHDSTIGIATDPNDTSGNGDGGTGDLASLDGHTHTLDLAYTAADNLPAYVNVLVYKYPLYTPKSTDWRWYDAEDVEDPANTNGSDSTTGDSMASENTAPSSTRIIYKGNAIKIRLKIAETGGVPQDNIRFRLQFDRSSDFPVPTYVAEQGATGFTDTWRYYNGAGTDDAIITNVRLSGSPSAGTHNETGTGSSTFDFAASTTYEFEFTIQLNPETPLSPVNSQIYYFRAYDTVNGTAVPADTGETYPSLTTSAAFDLEVSQAPSDVQLGTYNWGDGGSLDYDFTGGEEIAFWDKRGTLAAYDATVSSMSMSSGTDTIPGTDITWISTAANPPDETKALKGSFASDRTDMTGNTGQTLDTDRDAYQAGSTTPPDQARRGGFYFLPSMSFGSLDDRDTGDYDGTLTITVI